VFDPQDIFNFEAAAEKAMQVLARMKVELDAYRLKENANQEFISRREEIIASLVQYVDVCTTTFTNMRQQVELEYNRGYEAAVKKYSVYGGYDPLNPEHKEQIRASSVLRAIETQPDLF
jgi:hypothetical protein